MRRCVVFLVLAAVLRAAPVAAGPDVEVRFEDEVLRVSLTGSYTGLFYQVWRAGSAEGEYEPRIAQFTLCTGDCFVVDPDVSPGRTYYYRFVIQAPGGTPLTYGPFPVSVPETPVGARAAPNPGEGETMIVLSLPGSARRDPAVEGDVRILDLQGRTVRVLHDGLLPRGETRLRWDGRGAGGTLDPGIYFLRFRSPLGTAVRRLVRVR